MMFKQLIVEKFLNQFPDQQEMFQQRLKNDKVDMEDGIYIIWGSGINSWVISLLEDSAVHDCLLTRIFNFLEEMANGSEEERDLLMYSTLERLDDDKDLLKIAFMYMGAETKKLLKKVQAFLGE
jgi:hypothetical protein